MRIIAHRGNINGPNPEDENKPEYLVNTIELGFDVEADIWLENEQLFLGHDKPQYRIELNFLQKYSEKLLLHAKNREALEFLVENSFHVFWHEHDRYTITSKGIIFALPDMQTTGIYVMPEWNNTHIDKNAYGVCTDYCLKI